MTGPEPGGPGTAERRSATGPAQQEVDLVGPDLRVRGRISLGRFSTLADLVNHNRSFLALHEARLLDRAGEPTGLELAELVVNQDDVTFVGHQHAAADRGPVTGPGPGSDRARSDSWRSRIEDIVDGFPSFPAGWPHAFGARGVPERGAGPGQVSPATSRGGLCNPCAGNP